MSTLLKALSCLANSLSFCLDSLSTLAVKPDSKLVPGAKDHFIPFSGDLFSAADKLDLAGFGIRSFSTNFHKTVS
jgi:hypothetical protein